MIGEACNTNGYRYPKYVCASWSRNRGCHRFAIRQAELERVVLLKLKESLLPSHDLHSLEAELLDALRRRELDRQPLWEQSAVEGEVRQLERKVAQASENLGLLRGSAAQALAEKVNAWSERLDELQVLLAAPPDESKREAARVVEEAVKLLSELDELQPESSPVRLRALFQVTVDRVELHFGRRRTKKSHRNFVERGVLVLRETCAELRGRPQGENEETSLLF